MSLRLWTCLLAVSLVPAFADDSAQPQSLTGTWTAQGDPNGANSSSWTFEEKGDSVKVTHKVGTETLAEYDCNTVGKDCEIKEAGKKAKVSFWFNGPKLVELETKGDEVVRRRFSVMPQGDVLEVESTSISPAGKPEKVSYKRAQVTAGSH